MTTIDTRYILSPALQQIFRDRESGLPLRNGYVEFYRDVSRIDPKDVFIQSGAPGAYEAVSIGNVVTLSQAGAFSYDNNDVAILYFPFFQTAEGEIVDKYFIRVFNENGVEQFTREGWPQGLSDTDEEDNTFVNYIADGQFWNHRNLPNNGKVLPGPNFITYSSGMTTSPQGQPGSWSVNISQSSNANDQVSFPRISSYQILPEASPRYYLRYKCIDPDASDTQKHLIYRIANVNFGASTTEFFTYQFEASNIFSGSITLNLKVLKTFGAGGSIEEDIFIKQFSIVPGWNKYTANFILGDNTGKNLGANDDDMIEFYLEIPTDQSSDIVYDNFILRDGSFTTLKQQFTNPQQNQSATLTMPVPAHNLSDEGKVPVLTNSGFKYMDIYQPGDWKYTFSVNPQIGWLILTTDSESLSKVSGATFNGEKYRRLYIVLHGVPTALIEGGIKGDPNTDFDNNLSIVFPPMLGRVAGAAGIGIGLTARANGENTGLESVSLTGANNGPHSHTETRYAELNERNSGGSAALYWGGVLTSTQTGSSGSGTPHQNMQPTFFSNVTFFYGEN